MSPTRGAQGNALKTILGMPFVPVGGECGHVRSPRRACGIISTSASTTSARSPSSPTNQPVHRKTAPDQGHWPDLAAQSWRRHARFLQIAEDYVWLNPNLTLTVDWFGET